MSGLVLLLFFCHPFWVFTSQVSKSIHIHVKKTFEKKKLCPTPLGITSIFFLNFSQVLTFSLHSLRENQEEKMEVSSVQKNNKSYFSLFSLMSEVYFYQLCYYLCAIVLYTLEIDIDIFVRFSFIHWAHWGDLHITMDNFDYRVLQKRMHFFQ